MARAIHMTGPRSAGVFIGENCAALSESLIDSELFGHVRGGFTGAERAAVMATGVIIGVDALPDSIIDFALAERCEAYPHGTFKPQEMEMIESALIRFRGDKSKAARAIGWTPDVPKEAPCQREWTVAFRSTASSWRRATA